MECVKGLGWQAAPICDRMSTFGFTRWTKLCEAEGLKPVYGVEIPCAVERGEKKPTVDNWCFFAIDSLKPLHDLIHTATEKPRDQLLTYAEAMAAEGVYVVAGEKCRLDYLPPVHDRFFLGLSPATPKGLYRKAAAMKLRFVATADNHYPREEDKEFYRCSLGFRSHTQTYPMHIMGDDELFQFLVDELECNKGDVYDAFDNQHSIIINCNAQLKKAKLLVPEKVKSLKELCEDGAQRLAVDLNDDRYRTRLDRELDVIREKDFEDYFYILADLVSYAKTKMAVGPARGSSGGSLVCFLMGITAIDPIKYGLIFERFIDINRSDLPDIDVDFSDTKRDIIFEYARNKYGKDRVARLGTVGMFKGRSALNQIGTALRIPQWRIGKVTEQLIERDAGDARALKCVEDTFIETEEGKKLIEEYPEAFLATRIEGHPQNASQHAAGLLLTAEPITEYVAVDARTQAAWCDKKDSETLNLLKLDALGLTQLSIFERCIELTGEKIILEDLPLDDPAAFEVVNKGKYCGIFQLAGSAVRGLAKRITFESVNDLIDISAVARPGALDSGGAEDWIARRAGRELVPLVHPILDNCTSETYGVLIYQETVMRICREVAGLSWPDTSAIRKMIGQRLGQEALKVWEDKFIDGAMSHGGMEAIDAKALWEQIVTFGRYGFNKSHAVAYGIISYWCCWLKAHHPLEFAAATLDAETDVNKQLAILRELVDEGISYVPIDPEFSTDKWTIAKRGDDRILVGPVTNIKGIGPAGAQEILNSRIDKKPLKPGLLKKLENAKTEVDTVYPIADRIQFLHADGFNFVNPIYRLNEVEPGVPGRIVVMGKLTRINIKDEKAAAAEKGRFNIGPPLALNMWLMDDYDELFVKIDKFRYEEFAKPLLDQAKAGKSLYAFMGTVPRGFRMLSVLNVKYLGEIE